MCNAYKNGVTKNETRGAVQIIQLFVLKGLMRYCFDAALLCCGF